jgi:uncharacterized protein YxjI
MIREPELNRRNLRRVADIDGSQIYGQGMSASYQISRKWALGARSVIADDAGIERFAVQGPRGFSGKLSIRDAGGVEVAAISRRGLGSRYEIRTGSELTTMRPRGFAGRRFEIVSGGDQLEARGNFSGRQYSVTRNGAPAAAVTQLRTFRERFAVEVSESEDPVLMLAVVLVIETIRAQRSAAAASG